MIKNKTGETLTGLSPELKKEIILSLVASLLGGLNENEKKDILQAALTNKKKSRDLFDMVGH